MMSHHRSAAVISPLLILLAICACLLLPQVPGGSAVSDSGGWNPIGAGQAFADTVLPYQGNGDPQPLPGDPGGPHP